MPPSSPRRLLGFAALTPTYACWGSDRVVRRLIGAAPPWPEADLLERLDRRALLETRLYVRRIRRLLTGAELYIPQT